MQNFSKKYRLLKADDYSSVFVFNKVRFGRYFKLYYKPNDQGNARLGIIVSKKISKRANCRNYMKRIIRDTFCYQRLILKNYDLVVRVARFFDHDSYSVVSEELVKLMMHFKN